jgi:starvation-inducible DNA-binding protein
MHPTHNTLDGTIRAQSIALLNRHLAAAIDLHGQIKQAHWNVRGPGFASIHELFDRIAREVLKFTDALAERAGSLGGTAHGTVHVAAARSFLIPYDLGISDESTHLFAVSSALAAFGQSAREAIGLATGFGDPATADLFTGISRGIDKQLWLAESNSSAHAPKSGVVDKWRAAAGALPKPHN